MSLKKLGRSVSATVLLWLLAAAAIAQVPSSQHVVLVINENSSYSDVMANMPWLIAHGNANGYATKYQSDNGGSLLDYLWLASGSCHSSANCTLPSGTHDFNCNGNDCYYSGTGTNDPITDDNIFRLLNNAGISWKVYAQSYAAAGGTPTTPDNNNGTAYYRRHNGATWYSDILNNVDGSAGKIVDLAQLSLDLAKGNLPRFMIIVPDGNHDGHDCPVGMSSCTEAQKLGGVDLFLSGVLDPILSTPDFQPGGDGLIMVTFDECGGGTNAGCGAAVYTALIGPRVAPHTVSQQVYRHENTLRTMLESLGITTYPGASAGASDMSDFFTTTSSKLEVMVSAPANNATLSSPLSLQATAFPTSNHGIVGWCVYVDSALTYAAGTVPAIRPRLKMGSGAHTIVVRAWDSSGAFGDQTFNVTVKVLQPAITILTPASGATVGSPVNLQAKASASAGQTIAGWAVYVDGVSIYKARAVAAINTNVPMLLGKHSVVVRAWDTSSAYGDQTLTLYIGSKPAVAVFSPSSGTTVNSPLGVRASAWPSPGHSISGWTVYLDGKLAYQAGAVTTINANLSASTGSHTLVIRAWDSSGAYGDRTVSLQVQPVGVNILTPANGTPVTSPVNLIAGAFSKTAISWWEIYVDSTAAYAQESGNVASANLAMSPGTHSVVVRAWDSTGASGDQTIKVTVP